MAKRGDSLPVTTPEAPAFDGAAGTVDLWVILAAEPAQLAAEIERGDHDACLTGLVRLDRSQHQGGRAAVQAAAVARGLTVTG